MLVVHEGDGVVTDKVPRAFLISRCRRLKLWVKRRTHLCACSATVPGVGRLCLVKVAKALHSAARSFAPVRADLDPGMRPS